MIKFLIGIFFVVAIGIFMLFAHQIDRVIEFSILIFFILILSFTIIFFVLPYLRTPSSEEIQIKKVIKITFYNHQNNFAEIITVNKFEDYYIDDRGDYYYFVRSYTSSNGAIAQLITNKSVKLFEINNEFALKFLSKPEIEHLEV